MTFKIRLLFLVLSLTLISACTISEASSESRQEVVIDDQSQQENPNEITITEDDVKRQVLQNLSTGTNPPEQTIIADDKSKITTTFDGYGNKTETRCFVNHPRLDCIVVKTPAQGKKQIIIYPFGNGAKYLDENSSDKALTASPDELANLAGVSETRDDIAKKPVSPYGGKEDSTNLRPLPGSAFPVLPKQMPQVPVEDTSAQTEEEAPSETEKSRIPNLSWKIKILFRLIFNGQKNF